MYSYTYKEALQSSKTSSSSSIDLFITNDEAPSNVLDLTVSNPVVSYNAMFEHQYYYRAREDLTEGFEQKVCTADQNPQTESADKITETSEQEKKFAESIAAMMKTK
ncbi:hypothetical protein CHS0354_009866 [Potamilus streckersoni]|uniref:Uncharacterized protein n=1 Tax=Potamilus streckersoni TaxID=2493646 RepID=A0AAE0SWQ8_9BIVA|nr:hypothetical protein CHS0354_009866 [Potamilus streckersoni]